jgi:hypothetical protein
MGYKPFTDHTKTALLGSIPKNKQEHTAANMTRAKEKQKKQKNKINNKQ